MMKPVSARERRLVALLVLVAMIAFAWFAIVAPIANGFAVRAERRQQLLLRYTHNVRTIAAVPRLRRQAESQFAASRPFAIAAANREQARNWLNDRLQRSIERVDGEFRDVADVDGREGWARARVTARLTLPQLTELLAQVQNSPPWLIVESLSIGANDALVTGQSSTMDVQLEASIPLRSTSARPAATR
ncbi:type II secretion system protein GspM [Sphingomonas sp. H39-1-10]|uniref:type II secretion system protein GspM n=1 Tax=Sphingomonas pollutisoli TaxID=3030829 RepID=UPI0023B949E8|nr:type II secretion system protein GspM [Sphingomonas pollutisoli]MDF0487768.1 type II secretion system protein GspM [Sphingomonas pollutisoli]